MPQEPTLDDRASITLDRTGPGLVMPPFRFALLSALLLALAPTVTHAQSYPSKPIRLVVPFGPGGPTDVAARVVSQVVQSGIGQSVVIENRPGAGGATGTKSVASADPDGYTMLIGTSATLGVVPALVKNPGYDPVKSFAAVAKISDSTTVLVVPPGFPPNSVQELVAYAKANPGKLSYASAGHGNQTQLAAELLLARAGITAVHVPYKSGAEMVTAVLSEQVQMTFPDISILLPLIQEKKIKALAVTGARRHPQLPDVPTMAESGIADYVTTFWTGVIVPAGTPPDIVNKLNAAINDGLKSQLVQDSLGKVGAQPAPGSPQDFGNFIADETRKWSAIAQTAGLSPQ
jgi:tripartite-type tricarboxylate transporter receptor subunit TctC